MSRERARLTRRCSRAPRYPREVLRIQGHEVVKEFRERTCFVILSVSEGPPYFCRGSFGVFAPQDDEKTEPEPGLSLPDFFTTTHSKS